MGKEARKPEYRVAVVAGRAIDADAGFSMLRDEN